jgi:hypothetical protein
MMLCPETLVCFNMLDTAGLVQQMSHIRGSDDSPEQLLILSKLNAQYSISLVNTDGIMRPIIYSQSMNYSFLSNSLKTKFTIVWSGRRF